MARRSKRGSRPVAPPQSFARIEVPADADPDHHLWRNGRLWWIAFTVHRGHLQDRVRLSLKTGDVETARAKRDEIFRLVETARDCRVSLRFQPRGQQAARRRSQADAAKGVA